MASKLSEAEIVSILWAKTRIEGSCWLWLGSTTGRTGHGEIRIKGVKFLVHRLSAHIFHGMELNFLPNKQNALHKQECLNKNCWCPDHLYVGDDFDNGRDRRKLKTHCVNGHEYTLENTIGVLVKGKETHICRICKNARAKKAKFNVIKEGVNKLNNPPTI